LSEVANFKLPHLHLAPPLGVIRLSFAEIFGIRKLESLGYRGVVCVILRIAFPVEHRLVTDKTDRQTHDYGIYRASMVASRGNKNIPQGSVAT